MQALFYCLRFYAAVAIKTHTALSAAVLVHIAVALLAVLAADAVGFAEHAFDVGSRHAAAHFLADHGFASRAGGDLIAAAVLALGSAGY